MKNYAYLVLFQPDSPPVYRKCYPAVRHIIDGDRISARDCVLVKSGPRKTDIPYVAKIATLWEEPSTGIAILDCDAGCLNSEIVLKSPLTFCGVFTHDHF